MALHEVSWDELKEGGSIFTKKMEPGDSIKGRILRGPYPIEKHPLDYRDSDGKERYLPIPCLGAGICETIKLKDGTCLHQHPIDDRRFQVAFWNWDTGKAEILEQGPGAAKQLKRIAKDPDQPALSDVDIKVACESHPQLTKVYTVSPIAVTPRPITDEIREAIAALDFDEANGLTVEKIEKRLKDAGLLYEAASGASTVPPPPGAGGNQIDDLFAGLVEKDLSAR